MIVATLARKPLKGTVADNVVKHGAGGLALDACRIAGEKGAGVWGTSNATVGEGRMFNNSPEMREFRTIPHPGGRWPANVAFVHAEGCVLKGRRTGDDAFGEVEEWSCADGCPVVELDRQSGSSVSSGGRTVVRKGGGNVGMGKKSEASWSNDDPGFGDEGGASRFFKKVGRNP